MGSFSIAKVAIVIGVVEIASATLSALKYYMHSIRKKKGGNTVILTVQNFRNGINSDGLDANAIIDHIVSLSFCISRIYQLIPGHLTRNAGPA